MQTLTLLLLLLCLPRPEYRDMEVRAYCPEKCCTDGDGFTATMTDAYQPGIAADKSLRGCWIEVPGYGVAKVDDTGPSAKGNKIEVRFLDHDTAKQWGVRRLKVSIWR